MAAMAGIPATMRAVTYDSFANKNRAFEEECRRLIRIDTVNVPTIESDELLVKVHAASINPIDWKILRGDMSTLLRKPVVAGMDVAGTVVQVGTKAASAPRRFQVGDKIYGKLPGSMGAMRGTFADYVAIAADAVALKPPTLSFGDAAAIPLAGLTSYQALVEQAKLKNGDSVLVLGGSGGTGLFGVSIARALKAGRVAATCSPSSFQLVTEAGATDVFDYHTDWWNDMKGEKFDVVYDTVGGEDHWKHAKQVLNPDGRFVTTIGDYHGDKGVFDVARNVAMMMVRKAAALIGRQPAYNMVLTKSAGKQLDELTRMVEQGVLVPHIDRQFNMEHVADLFIHSYNGHVRGKAVLLVDEQANEK